MVRYSTGRALAGTLRWWLNDATVATKCSPGQQVLETKLEPEWPGNTVESSIDPTLEEVAEAAETVDEDDAPMRRMSKTSSGMSEEHVVEELEKCVVRRWLLCRVSHETHLRAALCAWHRVVAEERTLRAMVRSQQRLTLSPEVTPSVPPSPRPVLNALGAFLLDTEQPLVRACFCSWRSYTQQMRCRKATMMWLMERMALTQKSFVIQAVFCSWSHAVQQTKQPAWALELRRDVQNLLRDQVHLEHDGRQRQADGSDATVARASALFRLRAPWAIFLLLVTLSFLLSVFFRASSSSTHGVVVDDSHLVVDSDGDGVADKADLCPKTLARYGFRSSWQTDWDGDGCFDGVEDGDDDNDFVLNSHDLCPRTLLTDGHVDPDGCASNQRKLFSESPSSQSYLSGKLRDIVLEVIVGMLFTAGVNYAWKVPSVAPKLGRLFQQAHEKTLGSIRSVSR